MASSGGGVLSKRRRGSHVLGVALLSLAWLVLARPGVFTSCAAAPNGVTGRRDSDLLRVVLGEDPSKPSFEIVVRGKTWLASSQPYLRHEGTTRTPENGTLELVGTGAISGADAKLGPYDGVSWEWATTSRDGTRVTMKTAVKWFPHGVVLFEQTFPDGARWTQTPGLDCGPGRPEMATCPACASMTWPGLASAFPTFSRDPAVAQEDLGFLEFYGIFENGESGAWGPRLGEWPKDDIVGGLSSGPIALFNKRGEALVISSHGSFMSASHDQGLETLDFGTMGSLTSLPAGFSVSHVLVASRGGVNKAFRAWGDHLLSYYGKPPQWSKNGGDVTSSYIGYTTDNGAYYYYNPMPGEDMLGTLLKVHEYANEAGIPYRHVLLDSWWYYKDPRDGSVVLWEAREDAFAGGSAGMRRLVEVTGWAVTAHNRYWSNRTDYDVLSGGNFGFVNDVGCPCRPRDAYSVPSAQDFWDFLLGQAKAQWGLSTYEQDWLWPQFLGTTELLEDANLGSAWLLQMGAAASAHGLGIQYCMPFPRHLMQSVEISSVTQARASNDYGPRDRKWQWRIGRSSILVDALGLAPSKDGVYTTAVQPGGSQGHFVELRPELELIVAVLSTGPVQIADGVGFSDAGLISRACSEDGLILGPSRAATAMDFTLIGEAFGGGAGEIRASSRPEVWAAHSEVGAEVWIHVLAADLQQPTVVELRDLLNVPNDGPFWDSDWEGEEDSAYVAYRAAAFDPAGATIVELGRDGLELDDASGPLGHELWHVARPRGGVAILGELSKFVPTSPRRFISIQRQGPLTRVAVRGAQGEEVTLSFAERRQGGYRLAERSCVVGASGDCEVQFTATGAAAAQEQVGE